jgi:hypothetical protein
MKGKVAGSTDELMFQPPRIILPASAPAPSYTPLEYNGGPILSSPELVSFYWGSFTSTEIAAMQTWLGAFASFLSGDQAPTGQEPVVRQYGVLGAIVGQWYNDAIAPKTTVGWPEIQAKIAALQMAGNLPPSGSQRVFITFTKGITMAGYPDVWVGLHGYAFAPLAICPLPDGPNPMPEWQRVTSHEIMETATDPQKPSGWIAADKSNEGGDICNSVIFNMPFGTVTGFADNRQRQCSAWAASSVPSLIGTYNLQDGANVGLVIRGVDTSGAFINSFIRDSNFEAIGINGRYDETTNTIEFNTAAFPGDVLFATYYMGFAILSTNDLGGVHALAGTWYRTTISFDKARTTRKVINERGGWYADNHAVEI